MPLSVHGVFIVVAGTAGPGEGAGGARSLAAVNTADRQYPLEVD